MLARTPRRTVAAALAAAAVLIPASPALAHYCYRDFKTETAAEKAAKAGPWMTADEFGELIVSDPPPGTPQCAIDDAIAFFASQPDTRLFMGPGFLAGGTEGTDRTPGHVGYTPFDTFGASCP